MVVLERARLKLVVLSPTVIGLISESGTWVLRQAVTKLSPIDCSNHIHDNDNSTV